MTAVPEPADRADDGVRLIPLPRPTAQRRVVPSVPAGQGILGLELAPAAPPAPDPDPTAWMVEDEAPSAPGNPRELQDPRRWTAMLAQAVVEVLGGRRPATQLIRWLDLEVYERVRRSAAAGVRPRGGVPVRVRRVRVSTSPDGWVEAVAVVDDGTRCRAMALRLEALQRRWLCTSLDIV